MRKNSLTILWLAFISIFFCSTIIYAQNPTMDAEWTVVSNDGSQLVLELGIRTNTAYEHLGPAQFIFQYDDSYASFAGGNSTGVSGTDYNWKGNFNPSIYTGSNTGVTQPALGIIDIDLDFTSDTGADISSSGTYTPVVDLVFAISDPSKSMDITWAMSESGDSTIMDDVFDDNISSPTNFDELTFSGITVNPLPVTLLNFSAQLNNFQTTLSWATASEINNDYFTVERSGNGSEFSEIMQVKGNGNSKTRKDYTAYDNNPLSDISYYRLKQTDYNGASKTSNIVAVNNKQDGNSGIGPIGISMSGESSVMTYTLAKNGYLALSVRDMNGKIMLNKQIAAHVGVNKYPFNETSTWKPGMYIVGLYSGDNIVYAKMVIP